MYTLVQIVLFLTTALLIWAFIVGWKYRVGKPFISIQFYLVLLIMENLFDLLYFAPNHLYDFQNLISNIGTIFELTCISYFFFIRMTRLASRYSIVILLFLYVSISIFFWIANKNFIFSFTPYLYVLEGLFIIIPSFLFIYEIIKSELKINLREDVSFIINCGILFYFLISTPLFICWYNLHIFYPQIDNTLVLIDSLCFLVLVILILKGYSYQIQRSKRTGLRLQ
jgi:hypothetical protein